MQVLVRKHKSISYWRYRFKVDYRDYRGWLAPISEITRKQALTEVEQIKARILLGQAFSGRKPISNQKVIAQYLEYLKLHRGKSYKNVAFSLSHFSYFPDHKTINRADVQAYQRHRLAQGVTGGTVNRELAYYRSAFNRAGFHGDNNPFTGFEMFDEQQRVRYLSQGEIVRLLESAGRSENKHLSLIILTAILTGMRKQEILKLHVSQIDFDQAFIRIMPENEKSKKYKQIPLPAPLFDQIKTLLGQSIHSYVFENKVTGKPYGDIKHAWTLALDRAGVKDFRFHDLRHTFATYALMVTKDLSVIQTLLGHSRIRTTEKYAHVLDDARTKAIAQTSDFIMGIANGNIPQKN